MNKNDAGDDINTEKVTTEINDPKTSPKNNKIVGMIAYTVI